MEAPLCEAMAVGEFSPWARQLFNEWQSEGIIRLSFEPSITKSMHSGSRPGETRIVILENSSQSHLALAQLRASNQPLLIILMGQKFLIEDLKWAMEHKVYGILENPNVSDKNALNLFQKAQNTLDRKHQNQLLIQSLKNLILQTEPTASDEGLIAEMKVGLSKVERLSDQNELFKSDYPTEGETSSLPLAKSQTLADVLSIMGDLERTGTLWIKGSQANQEGKIDFIQGKVAFAETGSVTQLKAVYRMFSWESPRFLFHRKPTIESTKPLIPLDIPHMVKEGQMQFEKYQKIKKDIPPLHLKLDFVPQTINSSTSLSPEEFHALVQVVEFHYVADILDYSDHWDVELFESLINLRRSGYINVTSQAA